jgi:glycogen operon protein
MYMKTREEQAAELKKVTLDDVRKFHDQFYGANYGVEGPTDHPGVDALRTRQIKNMLATLLVSRGVPMLLGGDEFRRTQHGNNNAYCQDSETSWYDWALADRYKEVHRFTREMIALRRRHPVLRAEAFYTDAEVQWFGPEGRAPDWNGPGRAVGCRIMAAGDPNRGGYVLCLLFNADMGEQRFALPASSDGRPWRGVVDTGLPSPGEICEPSRERQLDDQRTYQLRDHSMAILMSG